MQGLRISQRIGKQRVSVRRRPRHIGCANSAITTALILDDDVLTDFLLQHRREYTRRHVRQAARRKGHHHGDGAVRIVLGLGAARKHQ